MIKTINLKTELSEAYSKNFNLIHSSFLAMNVLHQPAQSSMRSQMAGLILLASVLNSVACFSPRALSLSLVVFFGQSMNKALRLARAIGRRKTVYGRRKAVLRWCAEVKRWLK